MLEQALNGSPITHASLFSVGDYQIMYIFFTPCGYLSFNKDKLSSVLEMPGAAWLFPGSTF